MAKYGVLTWYNTYNYGTVLQSYAVIKVLNDKGFDTEIVAYQKQSGVVYKSAGEKIKDFLYRIPPALIRRIFWDQFKEKIYLFEEFLKNDMPQSRKYSSKDELIKDVDNYEAFICGSDQIWTPVPKGMDTTFFLDFVPENIKKISYAPSIGYPKIPDDKKEIMKNLISRINYLSIREEHGAKLIKELSNRDAKVVLDPTLLRSKEEWIDFSVESGIKEPYILCYFLGKRKATRKFVENLKRKTGCKIINIPVEVKDLFWGDEQKIAVGPREFVGLILGASYICTDSFHGTIFSLNLEKNFFALRRHEDSDKENQNLRLVNILSKLNLMEQMVLDEDKYSIDEHLNVNYDKATKLLLKQREECLEYLLNAVSK
jgi:hypothetical protein